MTRRLLILAVCVALTGWYLSLAPDVEAVPARQPLAELPLALGEWTGRQLRDFPQAILDELGVDDYASRIYARPG